MKKILLMVTIILCVVVSSCGSVPQEQKIMNSQQWENSIYNKENADFIDEVAFNESCTSNDVTQEMFDHRYSSGY